ncbi:MAG: carboxypeptidase-like regulatory domain-containing protein [Acidobacteriota bacterium]
MRRFLLASLVLIFLGSHAVTPLGAVTTSLDGRILLRFAELISTQRGLGVVVDEDGVPLADARVVVSATPVSGSPFGPRAAPPTLAAQTMSNGVYVIEDLVAGSWDLTVSRAGYAPITVRGLEVDDARLTDLGVVTLSPGVRITGRVVDDTGLPVPGAVVYGNQDLLSVSGRVDSAPAEATSDDAGQFVVADLEPGRTHWFSVKAEGFTDTMLTGLVPPLDEPVLVTLDRLGGLRGQVLDDAGEPVTGYTVSARREVEANERVEVDDPEGRYQLSGLTPGSHRVSVQAEGFLDAVLTDVVVQTGVVTADVDLTLRRGAVVVGRVTDEAEKPIAGARVGVEITDAIRATWGGGSAAITDDEGNYRLDGVEPGRRMLNVFAMRYLSSRHELEVQVDEDNVLDVELRRGFTLAGRVLEADGTPATGARVDLAPPGDRHGTVERTDDDGRFRAVNLAAGAYQLRATGASGSQGDLPEPLRLEADLDGAEIVLEDVAARVLGVVRGVTGDDTSRVFVYAIDEVSVQFLEGKVDYQGAFRFDGLAPGVWQITARHPTSQATDVVTLELGPRDERRVELDLDLPVEGALTGHVHRDGRPVARATVIASGIDVVARHHANSDLDGRFEVLGVVPGVYEIRVVDDRGGVWHERLRLDGDEELDVGLEATRLTGTVRDVDGEPVVGAVVVHEPVGGFVDHSTRSASDDRGRYALRGVPTGAATLRIEKKGYATHREEVDLSADDEVDIVLGPSTALRLRVARVDGGRVDAVHGTVLDSAGRLVTTSVWTTTANGEAVLDRLDAGIYTLLLHSGGSGVIEAKVSVPRRPLDVVLPAGGVVGVRVPALADDLSTQATLELTSSLGRPFRTSAVTETPIFVGRVVVRNVPAGTWNVTVRAADQTWRGQAVVTGGGITEIVLE